VRATVRQQRDGANDPSELMRANDAEEIDPESARLLQVDAAEQLDALGVDREDGLALAKQYLERHGDADVEGFVRYVRERSDRFRRTEAPPEDGGNAGEVS
jgi:hypothetical protein